MKIKVLAFILCFCAGTLFATEQKSATKSDSASVVKTEQQSAFNKNLIIIKPPQSKSNWSKLKDLFM